MFKDWGDYFFLLGSSSAALIGLMFVVVTLTTGRDRRQIEAGKLLYFDPIVCHLSAVVLVSGAAVAPTISPRTFGLLAAAIGVAGAIGCSYVATRMGRMIRDVHTPAPIYDMCWYGLAPAAIYLALGGSAIAILKQIHWSPSAVAASLMALLLVSIHNEWDLVTFLAPGGGADQARKS